MKTVVWFGLVLGALSAAGKVILTKPGQKTTIECGVNTYSNNVEWRHRDDLIINTPKRGPPRRGGGDIVQRSRLNRETNLVVSNVKEEDAGKFVCMTDGHRHEHTLLVVSVSASPSAELQLGSEATLWCQVKGLDPDPTVQWKRPDGSPHSGSQSVKLNPVAQSDAGTWKCTFSFDGTTHSESLAINVKEPAPETAPSSPPQSSGDIRKPNCTDCVTQPPPDVILLLGLSLWVWVAVGVGGLVVVLLMVFVIVLCKRIKRRKRKNQRMKNGRQPLKPKKYCQCDYPAAAAKPQQGRRREKPSAPPLQPLLMQ